MKILKNESNYIELEDSKFIYLISYTTCVCKLNKDTKVLYQDKEYYSRTTSKHINMFKNEHIYNDIKLVDKI